MSSNGHSFDKLIEVIDHLLGPDGCPWDQEQTVLSLSRMILEEVCETIDTIRDPNPEKLADELGDLFVSALFLAKVAEKEGRFSWSLPFTKAVEKLIRRHPHIFGKESKISCPKAVEARWDEVKATESEHQSRRSRFDGIARSLPSLAMVQKLVSKARKIPHLQAVAEKIVEQTGEDAEEDLGRKITQLVLEADKKGIQAEEALRRYFFSCKEQLVKHEQNM
jgi:uncharacterized protein YabN with tetrapyrrole methylase and pyrophosphatase domain